MIEMVDWQAIFFTALRQKDWQTAITIAQQHDINGLDGQWPLVFALLENEQLEAIKALAPHGLNIYAEYNNRDALHHAIDVEIDGEQQGGPPADLASIRTLTDLGFPVQQYHIDEAHSRGHFLVYDYFNELAGNNLPKLYQPPPPEDQAPDLLIAPAAIIGILLLTFFLAIVFFQLILPNI